MLIDLYNSKSVTPYQELIEEAKEAITKGHKYEEYTYSEEHKTHEHGLSPLPKHCPRSRV